MLQLGEDMELLQEERDPPRRREGSPMRRGLPR